MNSSDVAKTAILATMWFSLGLMGLGVAEAGQFGLGFVFPLLIASIMTLVVWTVPEILPMILEKRGKAKRGSSDSMSVLMEVMDEDERQEFKEQLKQRMLDNVSRGSVDGELPLDSESLESLLAEEDAEYKNY